MSPLMMDENFEVGEQTLVDVLSFFHTERHLHKLPNSALTVISDRGCITATS